jgi:hypothetical protein
MSTDARTVMNALATPYENSMITPSGSSGDETCTGKQQARA